MFNSIIMKDRKALIFFVVVKILKGWTNERRASASKHAHMGQQSKLYSARHIDQTRTADSQSCLWHIRLRRFQVTATASRPARLFLLLRSECVRQSNEQTRSNHVTLVAGFFFFIWLCDYKSLYKNNQFKKINTQSFHQESIY